MIAALAPVLARLRPAGRSLLSPALLHRLGPLMALAIGVTLLVLMVAWRDQAAYKPVFGAKEKVAAAEMMAALDADGVRYRIHPESGQVLVREADLSRVRMLLASKGVIAKLPSGLELMDRNDPLGVSQFVQDVRFRRGLEGELAQSIMTFDAVESARVHLSIAKSSSFVVSDGEKSSASVVVALKPGRRLGAEQIASAINLVAGSVASLDPQRVSLVDQAGNLLSARIDLGEGFDTAAQAGDAAGRFQDETRRNLHELLAPVLGDDNFKTSITAEVDNDRIQETRESYGDTPKVTNEATREESDRPGATPLGIPGSLSNRPAAVAASSPGDGGSAQKNATTRQFAYDRNITQIKRSRGRLAKLNVAVVLNTAAAPGGGGLWKDEQIKGVENLLRTGLGIDTARGDRLTVSAMPFPPRPVPGPWWQQRDNLIDIGGWLVTALGVLLGFLLIVRPLLKVAIQRLAPKAITPLLPLDAAAAARASDTPPALGATAAAAGTATAPARSEMPVVPLLENYDLPPPGSPVDVLVDHLKVLAAKEPERVAEVVKQWVQRHAKEA